MQIFDIPGFEEMLFSEMIENGFINIRMHPTLDLNIANYSDKAQINWVWNPVTMNCRGLVFDDEYNIVARGFTKFFTYDQKGAELPEADEEITVTDKADGSLLLAFPYEGQMVFATRGSFVSEQAQFAPQLWAQMDMNDFAFIPGYTLVSEIIYPENRIVVDYGTDAKLVLLGAVDNRTGEVAEANDIVDAVGWRSDWVVEQFDYKTLADVFASPARSNREGFVVRGRRTGNAVKIKYEEYKRLHKIVFGLSEKAVWEYMGAHDYNYEGMLVDIPDEFHGWVENIGDKLSNDLNWIGEIAYQLTADVQAQMQDRKHFAELAAQQPKYRPYMFMILDGKNPVKAIWRSLKPVGAKPVVYQSEDVA